MLEAIATLVWYGVCMTMCIIGVIQSMQLFVATTLV